MLCPKQGGIAIEHSKAIPFFYLHACKVLALGETLNNVCVLKRHIDYLLYGEINSQNAWLSWYHFKVKLCILYISKDTLHLKCWLEYPLQITCSINQHLAGCNHHMTPYYLKEDKQVAHAVAQLYNKKQFFVESINVKFCWLHNPNVHVWKLMAKGLVIHLTACCNLMT